jgi:hypothetical protein
MTMKKALSALELLIGVSSTLFIAGIAIPNLLRSATATKLALAAGSLHFFSIGRITFPYEFQGISFAILGSLFGAAVALAIDSPATLAKGARIVRMIRHAEWKCVPSRKNGRRSYIGDRKLA